jgi:hypothetical protein
MENIAPVITNQIFTLTALTNSWFNYIISVTGTTPIKFDIVEPNNYNGEIKLNGNIINGISYSIGTYNIKISASNNYGIDTKYLNLNVSEDVKIKNTNLILYNKLGSNFYYSINSSGPSPKIYNVDNLPPEISLIGNIMSGIFLSGGVYLLNMIVSDSTNSDSKVLTINVGSPPIITSSNSISIEEYSEFNYNITSNVNDVSYYIIGILPKGLVFRIDTIYGIPIIPGIYDLKLRAVNNYGESIKMLKINVYNMILISSDVSFDTRVTSFGQYDIQIGNDYPGILVDGDIIIDWGDGTRTETLPARWLHTYTDGLPVHTVNFYISDISKIDWIMLSGDNINIKKLTNLNWIEIDSTNDSIIDLPDANLTTIMIFECPNLTTINYYNNPVDYISYYKSIGLFPNSIINPIANLNLRHFDIYRMSGILNLSNSTKLNDLYVRDNLELTRIIMPPTLPLGTNHNEVHLIASNCALDEETVNTILILADSAATAPYMASVYLNGGTNAAPTGLGLIAKNSLLSKSCIVETN